jgi:hypothetical protein
MWISLRIESLRFSVASAAAGAVLCVQRAAGRKKNCAPNPFCESILARREGIGRGRSGIAHKLRSADGLDWGDMIGG